MGGGRRGADYAHSTCQQHAAGLQLSECEGLVPATLGQQRCCQATRILTRPAPTPHTSPASMTCTTLSPNSMSAFTTRAHEFLPPPLKRMCPFLWFG